MRKVSSCIFVISKINILITIEDSKNRINIKHIYLFLGLKINNIRSYYDGKIFKYNLDFIII